MIPFTQYLRPDGRKRPMSIERPTEIENKAAVLIAGGCRFEIEVLRTDEVSMTCEEGDVTWAHEICKNGPEIEESVDKLVERAWERKNPERTN